MSTHQPNLVQTENAKPGASDWQLTRVRLDGAAGIRSTLIEGYCSHQSVRPGDRLDIMVSTSPAARFTVDLYRMGYYGGAGARHLLTLGPLQGRPQPDPPVGPARLRACTWDPAVTITIPDDWVSGVYLGKLTTVPDRPRDPYWQSYVIFIVKDDREADFLFQCSDNTWQAYNRWPDDYSLYTDPRAVHMPGVSVSFDRPYAKYTQVVDTPQSVGSGEFLLWEFPLAYYMESLGLDVTYGSNVDTVDERHVRRCGTFISVGHDEYWDLRQYDSVKRAIDEGGNVLWLSANSVYCVSPFSPSDAGRPNRVITRAGMYGGLSAAEIEAKRHNLGPVPHDRGPDETLIIGARSTVPYNGGGDWTCTRPDHWLFEGTGMKSGDAIPGLVGWEHHGEPGNLPGLQVLAEGLVWSGGDRPVRWTATVFDGPKGNFVFNAATIYWSQGLSSPPGHTLPFSHWSRPHGPDPRVQRITRNLFARASASAPRGRLTDL